MNASQLLTKLPWWWNQISRICNQKVYEKHGLRYEKQNIIKCQIDNRPGWIGTYRKCF